MNSKIEKALFIISRSPLWSMKEMMEGFVDGFAQQGIDCELVVTEEDGSGGQRFAEALGELSPQTSLIVDFNARLRMPQVNSFRRYSYITDHPFAFIEQIAALPENAVFSYVDRSHGAFADLLGFKAKSFFIAHGGRAPLAKPSPIKNRSIGSLFSGRLTSSPRLDDLRKGFEGNDPKIITIAVETAIATSQGAVIMDTLSDISAAEGVGLEELGASGVATLLRAASNYGEAKARHDLIMNGSAGPITVIGDVAPDFFQTPPPKASFVGPKPYSEVLEIMADSKRLLNVVPIYPQGSHERVFDAMASGTVIGTDLSSYLAESFTHGEHLYFHNQDESALNDFLAAPDSQLQSMSDAAAPIYEKHHTWAIRAQEVLTALG